MAGSSTVALEGASPNSSELLSNLLGLYMHDMSEFHPVDIGADGRFRYEKLPSVPSLGRPPGPLDRAGVIRKS
jgi:hypothetical protein